MNKELGRKITSLTLMTIMLTWTASMGFSSTFMPEAYAENQYLYVSAESEGSIANGQVIEIVVAEPAISELDTAYGMPDVNVNGSSLIMAQAVDGAWYAYVADADYSNLIDSYYSSEANTGAGSGADYGRFCGPDTELAYKNDGAVETGLTAGETQGIFLPHRIGGLTAQTHIGTSAYVAGDSTTKCTITANGVGHTVGATTGQNASSAALNNVVREAPSFIKPNNCKRVW